MMIYLDSISSLTLPVAVGGLIGIILAITEPKRAQAKLTRERALLRCLIDSVDDLIFIKDQQGVYRGCNKASEAFIGLPESEQIGKTDFDFFDREKAEQIRKADRRVLEEGKPLRIEEWVTCRDGRRLLMDTHKAPYYGPDGELLGLVGIGRDITAVWEAEMHFRDLVENWPDEIARYDLRCRRVYVNPCMEKNMPGVHLLGRTPTETYPDSEKVAFFEERLREVLATGAILDFETGWGLPAVEPRYRMFRLVPERDAGGKISGVFAIARDITERRLAEEALRKSEEKYRRIVDTAGEGILVLGPDTRTTFVNTRMTEVLGYCAAEMTGRPLTDFMFAVDVPDHLGKMEAHRKGLSESYERRFRRKDGGIVWTRAAATPILDEAGRFQGSFGMFTDITDLKQAENALLRMNRQLRAISTCNQLLMKVSEEQTLLEKICRIVCEEAGYRMAWVGYSQNDDAKTVRPVAWAGVEEGYLAEAGLTWADTERGGGPTGRAIREGISAFIQDFATDPHAAPWRKSALQRGYRSSIALPLKEQNGTPFGVLCIYSAQPGSFTLEEMTLLDELAGNLAFGITTLRIRAEHKKAEMQILASEQLFRALVENSPDFISRYDREFRRIYVNPAIQKLFGGHPENVLGKTPSDQSPVYAPQIYIDRLRQTIATATESTAEMPFRTAQGEMHWGHMRFVPEFGPDGKVVSVLAIGRDIHEIKENEQRFRMLAENFPDFIVRFDRDGRHTYVNQAVEKAFGIPTEAIVGKTLQELPQHRKPEQNDALLELIRRAFDEGVANESEALWDTAIGARIFEIRHAPEKDATGNVVSVLSIARDITERKQTEEELARHREHLEEIVKERTVELEEARNQARQYLDIAGVILVAIDTDRRVTLINQKGCEVLESSSGEIIGKDWFETFVPENIRQDVIQGFRQLMAGELEPMEYFENPVLTLGGRERLVAWHNVLLRDGDGHITGTLSSGEDITERRRAEKQIINLNQDLQKRAAALEAANKELDAFAYSVSHDLRAPLRHIDGFLELLQKKAGTALDEQSRHYMGTISEAAQKMGLLIDDLLSFSRMGRHALSFQKVDLGPLVRDVIRELEPDAAGRNIEWRIGDLPPVGGDAALLRIVLGNLISNALKFTRPRQQAQIEIGSIPGQASEAVIFVRDNGVGFDMTYADKLFGVFQRLHRTEEFEGTGIGLATVRRIISRHGGRTWAQREPEQGATFFFSLP